MLQLRNQFIFAPVKTGYSDGSGRVTDKHIEFYKLRSAETGGVALEPLYLDKGLREIPTQMGLDSEDKIPGLSKLNEVIHQNGSKVIAHLNHPGRMANPKIPGNYFLSSTDQACENGGAEPKRMDRQDMNRVVEQFRSSAALAEKAGFDALGIQFGHGYLLGQFISPAVNDRNDEYGGSLENRIRFPLEVLDAVRGNTSLPIIARISGDEMTPNGIKPEEMVRFAAILADRKVQALNVSAGTICSTPPWFFQHMFVPKGKTWELASEIRDGLKQAGKDLPFIFVGRINSKEDVDRLMKDYKADYLAIGRGLLADHQFVGKYLGKVEGKIRPCLACAEGCLGGVKSGEGLQCVVNPLTGNEGREDFQEKPVAAGQEKSFAVVGGGPAGMEAALTLHKRGHKVELFEREELGGQLNLAHLPPNKESLKEIVDYYRDELDRQGVPVRKEEATAENLKGNGYNGVLLAAGAEPMIPPIKGLKEYYWTEFLYDENLPTGKRVVVIGGGLIGMELASKLVEKNNDVTIVEMLPEVATGMEMIEKSMTMKKLAQKNVTIYTNFKVEEIDRSRVILNGDEQRILEDIDHIVVTAGMRSRNDMKEEIEPELPVYVIGDAKKVGKAQTAILSGRTTALQL